VAAVGHARHARRGDRGARLAASSYAFGLGVTQTCDFRTIVAHSGGLPGFGSIMRWLPDYGVGIIAFGNLTYTGWGSVTSDVLDRLAKTGGLERAPCNHRRSSCRPATPCRGSSSSGTTASPIALPQRIYSSINRKSAGGPRLEELRARVSARAGRRRVSIGSKTRCVATGR
jgi:hypothetical protein